MEGRKTNSTKEYTILHKFFSLLSVVRGYNILIVVIAQYLGSIFIFSPNKPPKEILLDPNLFLIVLASAAVIAAGYIINNFYDADKDRLFGFLASRLIFCSVYFWNMVLLAQIEKISSHGITFCLCFINLTFFCNLCVLQEFFKSHFCTWFVCVFNFTHQRIDQGTRKYKGRYFIELQNGARLLQ